MKKVLLFSTLLHASLAVVACGNNPSSSANDSTNSNDSVNTNSDSLSDLISDGIWFTKVEK